MAVPKAFIFDLDGVITDTAEYHYQAWKRLADEEGVPFTREDNDQLRGVSRRQSLLFLLKGRVLPEDQMEAWMARKNDYYKTYLDSINPKDLLPGVGDFLKDAKARGLKIGLASASRNAHPVLHSLGIFELFDAIGDGYTVHNTKPAADLFVWVAGRMDVCAMDAVVFEDAEAGVEAALTAGMHVVGLGPHSRVGKAHLVCSGLKDLNVEQVLQAVAQKD